MQALLDAITIIGIFGAIGGAIYALILAYYTVCLKVRLMAFSIKKSLSLYNIYIICIYIIYVHVYMYQSSILGAV